MAALNRAIAVEEMHAIAMRIGEDLDLDMAGARKIFFDEHAVIAKSRERLAFGAGERGRETPPREQRFSCPCRRRPPTGLIKTG